MGLEHVVSDVGDRYVMEKMISCNASIGGEESGHTIFSDYQTTGDGILTALMLIESMKWASKPLSELGKIMTIFPQVLINVEVTRKLDIESIPKIKDAIRSIETTLGKKGRVLVRYSGTQPLCRIMVEGENMKHMQLNRQKQERLCS
jgi:phosphoglucosamine mutase